MRDEKLIPGVELLESMRSVGYSFNAAAADIIDNSITAEARFVDVFADTVKGGHVAFLDDGNGMTPSQARDALKLAGTRHVDRDGTDLGRFGLGLKTASLSQGRRLSVITKRDGVTTGLQWDLDHVLESREWAIRLLEETDLESVPHADILRMKASGTLVVWESLDYLLAGAQDVSQWMERLVVGLRDHIGLVFQRFLEGRNALQIRVNGIAVRPIDPFLEGNSRTQVSPIENVTIEGRAVVIEAFTLPHVSALSAKERRRDDLGPRMREHQGFYVYRNRRLISAGGWFGLSKTEELSKQTRVRVDIPPSLDHHWQLDIKKSRVEPPQAFRQRFRQIIDQVKVPSARVHRFRGRQASTTDSIFFWRVIEVRDGFRYEVNVTHPAVSAVRQALPEVAIAMFDRLLVDLANSFPASDLYVRMSDNKTAVPVTYPGPEVIERLRVVRDMGALNANVDELVVALGKVEPFSEVGNLRDLVQEVWKESK